MKKCWSCKTSKDLSAFDKCSTFADGHQTVCRECKKKVNKRLNAIHNKKQMRVAGEYIKKSHPLHVPGLIAKSWLEVYEYLQLPLPELPTNEEVNQEGYVYVIYNSAFDGWYKVGKATNVEARLKNYQTGDPHRAYKVCYEMKFENCDVAERTILDMLQEDDKVIKKNEWVMTTIDRIRRTINEVKREEASSGHRDELNSQFDMVLCN
jgi:hypothetical protein